MNTTINMIQLSEETIAPFVAKLREEVADQNRQFHQTCNSAGGFMAHFASTFGDFTIPENIEIDLKRLIPYSDRVFIGVGMTFEFNGRVLSAHRRRFKNVDHMIERLITELNKGCHIFISRIIFWPELNKIDAEFGKSLEKENEQIYLNYSK